MFARRNISNVVSWNAGSVAAAGIMLAPFVFKAIIVPLATARFSSGSIRSVDLRDYQYYTHQRHCIRSATKVAWHTPVLLANVPLAPFA